MTLYNAYPRTVAVEFEVVQLGLTCAGINYSAREARLLGGSGGRKSLGFRPSEVVSDAIFE